MNSLNYNTYVSRLHGVHFRGDTGCLTVEAPNPLIAAQLNGHLSTVLRRVLATIQPTISGVQVQTIAAVPGPPHAWEGDEEQNSFCATPATKKGGS